MAARDPIPTNGRLLTGSLLVLGAILVPTAHAQARPATCVTSDEGEFKCDFRPTAPNGSFEITAPGRPTYRLLVESPGIAFGFVTLGGKSVPLPGRYRPSGNDPGCWVNDSTSTRICARGGRPMAPARRGR